MTGDSLLIMLHNGTTTPDVRLNMFVFYEETKTYSLEEAPIISS